MNASSSNGEGSHVSGISAESTTKDTTTAPPDLEPFPSSFEEEGKVAFAKGTKEMEDTSANMKFNPVNTDNSNVFASTSSQPFSGVNTVSIKKMRENDREKDPKEECKKDHRTTIEH